MCARLFALVAMVGLVAAPSAAWSKDDAGSTEPALTVRLKSVDDAIDSGVNLVSAMVDKSMARGFVKQSIEDRLGAKGLKGLDTRKPLGLYGNLATDLISSPVVFVLPITDEDDFLDLLARAQVKVEKAEDGVHKFMAPNTPFPGYLRFANQYAYLTVRDSSAIAPAKLLKPAQLFPAREDSLVVANLRIDRVPDPLKKKMLDEMAKSKLIRQNKSNETEAQTAFNRKLGDKFEELMKTVLQDGREVELRLDPRLTMDLSLTAKQGSSLAADIAELGQRKSRFGGLKVNDVALSLFLHVSVPEDLRQPLDALIDEGIKDAVDKEPDEAKRKILSGLFKALGPTLKGGEYDGAFVLRAPLGEKHATLVAGLALKDGIAVERAFRDAIKKLPEASQAMIKLDADSADGVKIHRLEEAILNSNNEKENKNRQRVFGKNPIYIAISRDAFFATMGANGLSELKQALAVRPQTSPPVRFALSLPRFGELAADTPQQRDIMKKLGEVGITLEGGPSLKFRMQGMGMAAAAGMWVVDKSPRPQRVPSPKPGDL
jgi:hypothetical protein